MLTRLTDKAIWPTPGLAGAAARSRSVPGEARRQAAEAFSSPRASQLPRRRWEILPPGDRERPDGPLAPPTGRWSQLESDGPAWLTLAARRTVKRSRPGGTWRSPGGGEGRAFFWRPILGRSLPTSPVRAGGAGPGQARPLGRDPRSFSRQRGAGARHLYLSGSKPLPVATRHRRHRRSRCISPQPLGRALRRRVRPSPPACPAGRSFHGRRCHPRAPNLAWLAVEGRPRWRAIRCRYAGRRREASHAESWPGIGVFAKLIERHPPQAPERGRSLAALVLAGWLAGRGPIDPAEIAAMSTRFHPEPPMRPDYRLPELPRTTRLPELPRLTQT